MPEDSAEAGGRGMGPDPGSQMPVVDPTKNVLDLVKAESIRQDGLREAAVELSRARHLATKELFSAESRFQSSMRDMESKLQNWMRDSEMKRINDLAAMKQTYETTIADMLRTSVESTSSLVSTQLVQIQSTFNDRVSQLERFRYETGGRSSVSDPATTDALTTMAKAITALQHVGDTTGGRSKGQSEMFGWVIAIVVAAVAVMQFLGAHHP